MCGSRWLCVARSESGCLDPGARSRADARSRRHHRLSLISHASPQDPRPEIDFVHATFIPEPKNYHTWTYIHWLYSHFSDLGRITPQQWDDELDWCEGLIAADGRNNSAWGWRWFLRVARPGAVGLENDGREEIE